jgi:DNA-binding LytR/AlgR family response regulator
MPPANAGPTNAPVNLLRSVRSCDGAVELERARDFLGRAPDAPLDRIFVREPNAVVPVMLDQVERIAAQDDYVLVHTARRGYLLSLRLGDLESRLPNPPFNRARSREIRRLSR